jgi:nucleoside-diphosphate-sugar epimerase
MVSGMRILVTGGGGFLGAALSTALAARGDTAIAFDLRIPEHLAMAAAATPHIVTRTGDITDDAAVAALFDADKPDAVIHCAAVVSIKGEETAREVFRINFDGAINVFRGMTKAGIKRVLHISSEEAYGAFASDIIDETHPLNPLYAYGISKVAVEQLGRTYSVTDALECINLRTSWVYGPNLPRLRVPRDFVEAAVDGRPHHLASGGETRVDQTWIDDFVDGVLLCLDHENHPYDVYNIASGTAPSFTEMVEYIRELVPGCDISIGPGAYQREGTVKMPRKGALDCSRAEKVFGYIPKYDLKAGLAAYIQSYRRADNGQREIG